MVVLFRDGSGLMAGGVDPPRGALAGFVPRYLARLAFALFFAVIAAAINVVGQIDSQRGIAAHPAQVTATVTAHHRASHYMPDRYTVVYGYGPRTLQADLPLPQEASAGDRICLDIDATKPQNARPCGTGVDLDDLIGWVILTGGCLAALVVSVVITRVRNSRRTRRTRRAAVNALTQGRQVAAQLHQAITDGRWSAGMALPQVAELAREYQVDEPAVDVALRELAEDGVIRWERGYFGSQPIVADRSSKTSTEVGNDRTPPSTSVEPHTASRAASDDALCIDCMPSDDSGAIPTAPRIRRATPSPTRDRKRFRQWLT
jgi:Bacterial regulatory proteins, gntR family